MSRLVQILGRLARPMAGLPEVREEVMGDAPAEEGEKTGTPVVEKTAGQVPAAGKKGKKKGKK